jgi:hypothetical protein
MTRNLITATLIGILPTVTACGTDLAESDDPGEIDEAIASDELTASDEPIASDVLASGVHVKGGKPSFTDNGLTLTASGTLEGLRKDKDVFIKLDAKGLAEARCTNPGGHQPPGQNPVWISVDVTGSAYIAAWHIMHGYAAFSVTTKPPTSPIPGAPDCPNRNWKETIVGVAFKSARLTVEQPKGKTVLIVSCTFSPPTANGPVPPSYVTCYST